MLAYTDEVLAADSDHGAHGVVASHPLRVRKALGSNPSVSIGEAVPQLLPLRSVFGLLAMCPLGLMDKASDF